MEPHPLSSLRQRSACLLKKVLIGMVTPVTGFLQRINLAKYHRECLPPEAIIRGYLYDGIRFLARCFSWFCQGVITLAYPTMGYHPIAARRQAIAWQWTSQILGVPCKELEQIARKFLLEVQEQPRAQVSTSGQPPIFTVLICFHNHLDFFKNCLDSIKDACCYSPETNVEILIINDDPSIDSALLLREASKLLQDKITLYANERNLGICHSANQAIARAKGEWILHLDCDDRLSPDVFRVLDQTLQQHPSVRFISSRASDIDEQGSVLSWRLRAEQPRDLIKNNVASHLKAIKKELHRDLGLFNPIFEGCQDYEFALRTAINEPLCFIPNYLYQYRWHNQSQTVSNNGRQNLTATRIRQAYLLAIYWMTHGTKNIQWKITGPYADSWSNSWQPWKPKISLPDSALHYQVTLEAISPYDEHQWRLLLVRIATIVIDRSREKDHNNEIIVSSS